MKILASDFDNTIYYMDDEKKNKKNVEAIKSFIAYGNVFCIITGRNYTSVKKLLTENDIPYSYLVCDDGAILFNNMDYCLQTILLDEKDVDRVEELLKELNCDYYLDDGYSETEYRKGCVKVVVNCDDQEVSKKIVRYVKEHMDIHIYASRYHVNIINKNVNKKNALESLIEIENLDKSLFRVIGDNDNDYEMLKEFDGAVMLQHHKKLDSLDKMQVDTLSDYIEYLMENK